MWPRSGVLAVSPRIVFAVMIPAAILSSALGLAYAGLGLSAGEVGSGAADRAIVEAAVAKGSVGPLAAAGLGAWAVGRLFAHGGLATALWLWPRRRTLALNAALGVLTPSVLIGALSALAAGCVVAALTSAEPSLLDLAAITGRHVLVCSVYGIAGGAIALAVRSRSAALALAVGWAMVAEPALRAAARFSDLGVLRAAGQALPGALAERLQLGPANPVVQVDGLLSAGGATGALLALTGILAAASWWRVRRLDA